MGVDRTDIRMIGRLMQNGRASLRTLAEALGKSPSTISNRFHALQDSGVITGFRPVVDYEKLGFGLSAIIEVKAAAHEMSDAAGRIRDMDRVHSFYEVTGSTDMVLVCKFLDREDLNRFVKQVQQDEGVAETNTKIVLTSPKECEPLDLSDLR